MKFNENGIEAFMFFYCNEFGTLTADQREAMTVLLTALDADDHITDHRHAAYMLATVKHETADTFRPIAEYGKGKGRKYGTPDPDTGETYYGRGYVQLTWAANYKAMGIALNIDLYHAPDMAMEPVVAYEIMSRGMRKGSFTGASLSRYINDEQCDYRLARKIINGLDCADRIAGYAERFEPMLLQCAA